MILQMRQCACRIDHKELVASTDLDVEAGLRYAVIGPNGAGKSTLLKMICRIMPLSGGSMKLDNQPMQEIGQKSIARWISYVPQTMPIAQGFTVREFVMMGRYPHLSPFTSFRRIDHEKTAWALDLTDMQPFSERQLDTLSGGEQQKVMIAAAVAQEARIMLLDEPTAFLDPWQQEQVVASLESIRQATGVTLIEVTHDVNRAALHHDVIWGFCQGRLVFQGTPLELMQPNVLQSIYGKTFVLSDQPGYPCPIVLPTGGIA